MVEDVCISANGPKESKRVLYLTNKHCRQLINSAAIKSCLAALNIVMPKCVICLLPSGKGVVEYAVHTQQNDVRFSTQQYGSDLNTEDATFVKSKLDKFMKDCILPLAKETEALVLCSGCSDDMLAASLQRAVSQDTKLRDNCPFKVLSFVWSCQVHGKASTQEGLAGDIASKCKAWKNRMSFLQQSVPEKLSNCLQQDDLILCPSHYIIFEGMDDNKAAPHPGVLFHGKLLYEMKEQIPSVAIQVGPFDINPIADLSRKGVPIVFLDLRERFFKVDEKPRTKLWELMKEHLSTIALAWNAKNNERDKVGQLQCAFEVVRKQMLVLGQQETVDYDISSSIALVHATLQLLLEHPVPDFCALYKRADESLSEKTRNNDRLIDDAAHFLAITIRSIVTTSKFAQVQGWIGNNGNNVRLQEGEQTCSELYSANSVLSGLSFVAQQWIEDTKRLLNTANKDKEYALGTDHELLDNMKCILSSPLTFRY